MEFSNLSSIYECCSNNKFYYIIRNNLLNDSYFLEKTEFKKLLENIKLSKKTKQVNELIRKHILVPKNYDVKKFIDYIKEKYGLKRPFINIIYLTFNTECNLDCKYCYVEGSFEKNFKDQTINEKVFEKEMKFLKKFLKEGIKKERIGKKVSFIFYGSEPLLCPEYIKRAIHHIDKITKELSIEREIHIITNGTLITGDLIELFKKCKVELAISLDGSRKVNDSMRVFKDNSGTYNKIISSIEKLRKNNIPFGISCTIGPHNLDKLKENIKFFKKLGAGGVGFNILLNAKNKKVPFVSLNKSNDNLIEASLLTKENNLYEDRIQRKIKAFNQTEHPHFRDCGAMGNQIVFYPNGEIGICQAYLGCRKYIIGSVEKNFKNPLEILDSKEIQMWNDRYPLNMKECLFCPAIGICGGGCVFNAEILEGNINERDKPFCVHTIKSLNWLLKKSIQEKLKTEDVFINNISFMFR